MPVDSICGSLCPTCRKAADSLLVAALPPIAPASSKSKRRMPPDDDGGGDDDDGGDGDKDGEGCDAGLAWPESRSVLRAGAVFNAAASSFGECEPEQYRQKPHSLAPSGSRTERAMRPTASSSAWAVGSSKRPRACVAAHSGRTSTTKKQDWAMLPAVGSFASVTHALI